MLEKCNVYQGYFISLERKIADVEANKIWHLQDDEVRRRSGLILEQARVTSEWGQDIKSFPLVALAFMTVIEGNSEIDTQRDYARRMLIATLYPKTKKFQFGKDDGMLFRLVCAIKASRYLLH